MNHEDGKITKSIRAHGLSLLSKLCAFVFFLSSWFHLAHLSAAQELHSAVYHDRLEVVSELIAAGADANAENRYGLRPLTLACQNGSCEIVRLLLDAGADANSVSAGGETVLMTAARTGRPEVVQLLLDRGARIDETEEHGQTALMWAAAEGNVEVVQLLMDAGADFRRSLDSGFTPLFFAVRQGKIDVVRALLEAGDDVNGVMRQRRGKRGNGAWDEGEASPAGMSPLHLAVENGHFELAQRLLEAGADPNDQRAGYAVLHSLTWVRKPNRGDDASGRPAPQGSGNLSSLALVEKLIEHGADANIQLNASAQGRGVIAIEGATPFLLAAKNADLELLRELVRFGADPQLPNKNGTTPLLVAAGVGTRAPGEEAGTPAEALATVKYLLDLGADINHLDQDGESVMHGAAYRHVPDVIHLLVSRGARPDVWDRENRFGWTPMRIAEGHRFGNFKPSPETIAALREVMSSAADRVSAGTR